MSSFFLLLIFDHTQTMRSVVDTGWDGNTLINIVFVPCFCGDSAELSKWFLVQGRSAFLLHFRATFWGQPHWKWAAAVKWMWCWCHTSWLNWMMHWNEQLANQWTSSIFNNVQLCSVVFGFTQLLFAIYQWGGGTPQGCSAAFPHTHKQLPAAD